MASSSFIFWGLSEKNCFSNIFDPQLVESADADPADVEGRVFLCGCVCIKHLGSSFCFSTVQLKYANFSDVHLSQILNTTTLVQFLKLVVTGWFLEADLIASRLLG